MKKHYLFVLFTAAILLLASFSYAMPKMKQKMAGFNRIEPEITEMELDVRGRMYYDIRDHESYVWHEANGYLETNIPVELKKWVHCYSEDDNKNMNMGSKGVTYKDEWHDAPHSYDDLWADNMFMHDELFCSYFANNYEYDIGEGVSETFNEDNFNFPEVNMILLYKDIMTDEYFVYMDVENYNGGIREVDFDAEVEDVNGIEYETHFEEEFNPPIEHYLEFVPLEIGEEVEVKYIDLWIRFQGSGDMRVHAYGFFWFEEEEEDEVEIKMINGKEHKLVRAKIKENDASLEQIREKIQMEE